MERRLAVCSVWLSPLEAEGEFTRGVVVAFTKMVQSIAFMRTVETTLAVERYRLANNGRLPSDLNALTPDLLPGVPTDPFDGRHLRFARLAKGCVVYSVGVDGRDNGGKEAERGSRAGEGGTDITLIVERWGGLTCELASAKNFSQALLNSPR